MLLVTEIIVLLSFSYKIVFNDSIACAEMTDILWNSEILLPFVKIKILIFCLKLLIFHKFHIRERYQTHIIIFIDIHSILYFHNTVRKINFEYKRVFSWLKNISWRILYFMALDLFELENPYAYFLGKYSAEVVTQFG